MQEIELPNKKYFKIGETSSLLGIKPHVLRYSESFTTLGAARVREAEIKRLSRAKKLQLFSAP